MSIISPGFWWLLEIVFPFELEDSFIWKCNELGINRIAIKYQPDNSFDRIFCIWLPANEWKQVDRIHLVESLRALNKFFDLEIGNPVWTKVKNEDWSSSWKLQWEPDPIATRLLILPSWLEKPEVYSDRLAINLDPGSAFGTGSHPSTRLCLEFLDRYSPVGLSVADLGCGSGILALSAIALGAESVFALDSDALAIGSTINNSKLNNVEEGRLLAALGSIETLESLLIGRRVDLLLCNILASVIKKLAPSFERVLSSKGRIVLSGILLDEVPKLMDSLTSLGWKLDATFQKDEWVLLEISRIQHL